MGEPLALGSAQIWQFICKKKGSFNVLFSHRQQKPQAYSSLKHSNSCHDISKLQVFRIAYVLKIFNLIKTTGPKIVYKFCIKKEIFSFFPPRKKTVTRSQ